VEHVEHTEDSAVNARCAVILTALPLEHRAVLTHLTGVRSERHPKGNIYDRGSLTIDHHQWDIGVVQVGMGNTPAAIQTERAIDHFNPGMLFFVGVAGGLKDVHLGDVVVASKVYAYESGKAGDDFHTRPEVGRSSFRMTEIANSLARDEQRRKLHALPRVIVAPIAAGASVVTSTDSTVIQLLRQSYNDAVAVEMEGHGFYEAIHANSDLPALVIRGISDLIDNKGEADAAHSQELAVRNACAIAFEILADLTRGAETDQQSKHLSVNVKAETYAEMPPREKSYDVDSSVVSVVQETSDAEQNKSGDAIGNAYALNENLGAVYKDLQRVLSVFDAQGDIFEDQCDTAIQGIHELLHCIKDRDTTDGIAAEQLHIDNIRADAQRIQGNITSFQSLCSLRRNAAQQKQYNQERKRISREKNTFLQRIHSLLQLISH
jgi:nucleoside phosphorylase